MLAPRHSALRCKAFANMDTSNEMDTDVLQVSSTSDERPTSQVPSHALAVIQTAAKASSESDSSPHVRGRNRPVGVLGVKRCCIGFPACSRTKPIC